MSLSFGPIQQLLLLRKLCLLYKKKKSDKKVKGFSLIIGEILLTWYHILKTNSTRTRTMVLGLRSLAALAEDSVPFLTPLGGSQLFVTPVPGHQTPLLRHPEAPPGI